MSKLQKAVIAVLLFPLALIIIPILSWVVFRAFMEYMDFSKYNSYAVVGENNDYYSLTDEQFNQLIQLTDEGKPYYDPFISSINEGITVHLFKTDDLSGEYDILVVGDFFSDQMTFHRNGLRADYRFENNNNQKITRLIGSFLDKKVSGTIVEQINDGYIIRLENNQNIYVETYDRTFIQGDKVTVTYWGNIPNNSEYLYDAFLTLDSSVSGKLYDYLLYNGKRYYRICGLGESYADIIVSEGEYIGEVSFTGRSMPFKNLQSGFLNDGTKLYLYAENKDDTPDLYAVYYGEDYFGCQLSEKDGFAFY